MCAIITIIIVKHIFTPGEALEGLVRVLGLHGPLLSSFVLWLSRIRFYRCLVIPMYIYMFLHMHYMC